MENLINLDQISEEKRKKIEEILRGNEEKNDALKKSTPTSSTPDEDELKAFLRDAKAVAMGANRFNYVEPTQPMLEGEIEGIDLDTGQKFDDMFNTQGTIDGYKMAQKRIKGNLDENDKETYRQLNMIHEDGKSNFWAKIKNVVDSKQEVDIRSVSDKIDPSDEWMFK